MDILQELLDNNSTEHFYITYKHGLANHMAQGLVCLHRLGADRGRMQRFSEWYQARLIPPNDPNVQERLSDEKDLEKLIGAHVNYYYLLEHYQTKLAEEHAGDIAQLVQSCFPRLATGMLGAAFHGLLLLGYGCAGESPRTVCEGLAYMHYAYSPLNTKDDEIHLGKGNKDITEVLEDVQKDPEILKLLEQKRQKGELKLPFNRRAKALAADNGDLLMKFLRQIKTPLQAMAASTPKPMSTADVITLCKWAIDSAIYVYAKCAYTNDFFFVHGVTSSWALLQVVSLLKDPQKGLKALQIWLACFLATYIAQGSPTLDQEINAESLKLNDWDDIVKATLEKEADEHVYKLVQVARERAMETDDEDKQVLYKSAANEALHNKLTFFEFS